jgi:integrase
MTSIRLKFIQAWVDREGRVHRYFRRPGFLRVRLPGLPGSAEFMSAYQDALGAAKVEIGAKRSKPGSVNAVIAGYYTSLEFRSLAAGTQKMRRAILERFRREHGDKPIVLLPQKFIVQMLSKMKPFAARNWLKTIRGLIQFAVAQELCPIDVTQGIKLPKAKTDGHHTWTEFEITQFEEHHPIGSRARLALALGVYTGLRRGDAVAIGPQHLRDGVLTVRQSKTGGTLRIPVHTDLLTILDATPSGNMAFLMTGLGKPFTASGFGGWFRTRCNEAGLSKRCSFHGLRKAACRRLAEAGCSANEIAAISGHVSLREVERYTRAADQERMARNALERAAEKNIKRIRSVKLTEL